MNMDITVEIAEIYLRAYDENSLQLWLHARDKSPQFTSRLETSNALSIAVQRLMRTWFHDGSVDARREIGNAAEQLWFEIDKARKNSKT